MANIRKSLDGRKRARTMEYIDSQVDINDEEHTPETNLHIGQHIHAQFDLSMSVLNETTNPNETIVRSNPKLKKRDSEQCFLQRQLSDMTLNRLINETNKTTTELKGREHILRLMKTTPTPTPTTTNKSIMEFKNHKFIQDMIAKRQEKQEINKPISDFALKYGLIDNNGKKFKSRKTSEIITDMANQLESLKSTLTKRQLIDPTSPLLRIVKLETVYNQLLCYCQYVTNQEDLILFLDPNNEQTKNLSVNDEIRIAGESRFDMNLPELGSVSLGITDLKKESNKTNEEDISMKIIHTYDFNCSCNKCNPGGEIEEAFTPNFDLMTTFPENIKSQSEIHSVVTVYDSFTLALMSKRIFDLRASIIIYNPDKINHRYIFIVRDGIGNCLEIILNDLNGLHIEIQTKIYIFYQIEFIERIESPKELNRWPYDNYMPPKKLFCFRSINNQVSIQ